jgi:cytochrome c oxidase subunit 2
VQAATILTLWHITLAVCSVVFAGVLAALLFAVHRSRRGTRDSRSAEGQPTAPGDRPATRRWVAGASIASALALAGLVIIDFMTDRALSRLPVADALHIEMTGSQWWWEARYRARDGKPAFAVSNDLHIPVGRPVVVTLQAADVIHTFWVPALHGKKDMLPGRPATIEFRADKAGTYRGQCAEFCGVQHAFMAFGVTAEEPEQFDRWQTQQSAPAASPSDDMATHGRDVFLASSCAGCHTVRGTSATGNLGPDLTHFASRPTIAAGTVPNEPSVVMQWVRDPQSLKTGTTMPPAALQENDLQALVHYLASLK